MIENIDKSNNSIENINSCVHVASAKYLYLKTLTTVFDKVRFTNY